MEKRHRDLLIANRRFLEENLDMTKLFDLLVYEHLMTFDDCERLKLKEKTRTEMAREFVCGILPRRGPDAFERFIAVLMSSGQQQIAYKLESELAEQCEITDVLESSVTTKQESVPMSAAKTKARWFRVYSADRKTRKAVGANTLEDFIAEAKRKFEIDSTDTVNVVLEEDGTCVDEEEYFQHGLETNCVLMLLKSDEIWSEYGVAEVDVHDGDEPDCPISSSDENFQLKRLCSRLRKDLKEVLLFSTADCQVLVDADTDVLCGLLHRNSREVDSIQSACQRYIDEHAEYDEARSLLQLINNESRNANTNSSTSRDDGDSALSAKAKRKRRK